MVSRQFIFYLREMVYCCTYSGLCVKCVMYVSAAYLCIRSIQTAVAMEKNYSILIEDLLNYCLTTLNGSRFKSYFNFQYPLIDSFTVVTDSQTKFTKYQVFCKLIDTPLDTVP